MLLDVEWWKFHQDARAHTVVLTAVIKKKEPRDSSVCVRLPQDHGNHSDTNPRFLVS